MIYTISGLITHQHDNKIILQQAGIGFELTCPQAKNFTIQQNVTLYTYLHWSAEQGPSLYGFLQPLDKDLFLMIIGCSGIGPKLGITILDSVSSSEFLTIICQENISGMNAIKGVGTKKAEQLILQLKEKAMKMVQNHPIASSNTIVAAWVDLQQTLTSLNYSPTEIKQTTSILKDQVAGQTVPFDLLLRKALTLLAKK